MSTIKISEMTPKVLAAGTELIPVSDALSAKSVTIDVIRQYVVDAIEAISAGTAVTGADSVFILQSGALKPVDIDLVAQHAIDTVWGKADYTPASGSDKMVIKSGSTEKTCTVTNLAAYIKALIESSILDVSDLTSASSLASGDYYLVVQGTTPKKTTLSAISTAVFTALKAYVVALTAVGTPADSDVFYVIQGGVEKKVTLSQLKGVMGSAIAPATTTENNIPQWSSAQKTLKDGLSVQTTIRSEGVAADTAIPTEQAVRELMNEGTFVNGSTTGAVAMRFGASIAEGLETVVVDKTVDLGSLSGVAVFTVPQPAYLKSVQAVLTNPAVAGGTTVLWGLGMDTIYPNQRAQFGSGAFAVNTKTNSLYREKVGSDVYIKVWPLANGDGDLGDTPFSTGSLRVRIIYERLTSLESV